MSELEKPDVLVLGGGGILGEAWMSALLAGLEEATGFDARGCEAYVGTSAGSIVAAALVAGVDPRDRLGELPEQPEVPDAAVGAEAPTPLARIVAAGGEALGPLAAIGLPYIEPGGALVRRQALARVRPGERSLADLGAALERWGARWDGRLLISAVDFETGRRVMFGAPGAPEASVPDAVEASCAIPGFFRPIAVDGRSYVDGGVWSPTNMDAAPVERGTRVLCLNPTATLRWSRENPYGGLGIVSRSLAGVEGHYLERRGAKVEIVAPDVTATAVMAGRLMDPKLRSRTVAAGLAQGRALAG
ncbi:MAG: patatin-like phospholipase family protein [Thermoleophilaceae bacterium]